ncbi:MAG: hypothetical protein Kow00129_01250 [Thermoleophilia bacterium]
MPSAPGHSSTTDRREDLRRSEERYRALFQTLKQGVLYQEPDGRVVLANPAAERILGRSLAEMFASGSAHPCIDAIREDGTLMPPEEHPCELARRTGEIVRGVVMGLPRRGVEGRRDGDGGDGGCAGYRDRAGVTWVRVDAVPHFRPGEDEPYLIYTIFEDITQERLLAEHVRTNQKLEALGLLAGGVAHDFNNMLTAILGYSSALEDKLKGGPGADEVGEIRAAAERAASLTRQLLLFSRRRATERSPVNVNEVVKGVEKMLGRLIGEDVLLEVRPEAERAVVLGDQGQLEQVVVNLAVNARDAMPEGGVLTIETKSHPPGSNGGPPHGEILLIVRDTGCGMRPEIQQRIFEPFFTTKGDGQGTGLGLSTVQGIAESLGGSVEVVTAPGAGSTFTVHLPLADASVVEATEARSDPVIYRGTETILIAEDEPAVRDLLRRMLEAWGYRVRTAGSGPQAEKEFLRADGGEGEGVDLLLSDLVMPGMSGTELARRLRTYNPRLPIVFMSGYPRTDEGPQRDGRTAFIQKPFDERSLAAIIRSQLDGYLWTSDGRM